MAFDVVAQITSSDAARMLGRLGASKGGFARKAKVPAERLTAIGKQGAAARWNKGREKSIDAVPPIE